MTNSFHGVENGYCCVYTMWSKKPESIFQFSRGQLGGLLPFIPGFFLVDFYGLDTG